MPLPLSDTQQYDSNGLPASLPVTQDQLPTSQPTMAQRVVDSLLGTNGQERYQLWPERLVRDALAGPHDVLNSKTPMTSDQMVKPAMDVAALAGTGGLVGAEATLGSGPFLRPALKYKDKIYKAPVKDASNPLFMGAEHSDAIPQSLLPEFTRQAMNGEDISNFNFGFINHKGQFLDREKALDYGIKEGLLSPHDAKFGALTSTMMADSKPATAIKALESPSSLAIPDAPSAQQMQKFSRIEEVPLSEAKATQSKMDWKNNKAGKYADPMLKNYADIPVSAKKENGEYLIYDGHHRAVNAINEGKNKLPMYVIDVKSYAPELAGRKPNNKQSMSDNELLKQLEK